MMNNQSCLLTKHGSNLGTAMQSCNNQYTSQPQGNESGFSNVAKATPSASILTSPYLASYQYDVAGNRTAKYRLDGGSSYAVDDENRLTTEQPFAVQALTPSTTTTQDNWVELDFGALVAPFRLDVALPDTNRRFKIQWHDGTSYQDISSGAVLGANLEQDGYYRPFSQDCRFLFVSVAMQKIRYWQESGSSAGVSLAAYTIVNGTPIAYAHDANGNMTSRTQGTSVETYAHDYANRIATYSDQQAAYSYIFSPSGERMAKTNVGTGDSEWYMYDGDDVVADYALPSGGAYSLTATYANGLGIDTKIARFDATGAPSYYIPDALGSVHRILDGAQNVVNTYLTNAWGESLVSQEGVPNRYGFTQRERDVESGLMHYRARSYDPRLGRFIQRDPILGNRPFEHYSYGRNNPVAYVDPKGERAYWFGGAGDKESLLGVGPTKIMFYEMGKYENRTPGSDSYEDDDSAVQDKVVEEIKKWYATKPADEPLILIGHSWGGVAAMEVAKKLQPLGIKVNVLLTLDPVSTNPVLGVPANQDKWVNVYRAKNLADLPANIPLAGQFVSGVLLLPGLLFGGKAEDDLSIIGGRLGSESGATDNIETSAHHGNAHQMIEDALSKHSDLFDKLSTPPPNSSPGNSPNTPPGNSPSSPPSTPPSTPPGAPSTPPSVPNKSP